MELIRFGGHLTIGRRLEGGNHHAENERGVDDEHPRGGRAAEGDPDGVVVGLDDAPEGGGAVGVVGDGLVVGEVGEVAEGGGGAGDGGEADRAGAAHIDRDGAGDAGGVVGVSECDAEVAPSGAGGGGGDAPVGVGLDDGALVDGGGALEGHAHGVGGAPGAGHVGGLRAHDVALAESSPREARNCSGVTPMAVQSATSSAVSVASGAVAGRGAVATGAPPGAFGATMTGAPWM